MKRNLNLLRDLLLVIEAADTSAAARYDLNPYDAGVQYHLRLLFEGGYVRGVGETARGAVSVRLTWQGHELLELARNEAVWERAMRYVSERTGGVSVAILHKLLEQWSAMAADSIDWDIERRRPPAAPPQIAPLPAPPAAASADMPFLLHASSGNGGVEKAAAPQINGAKTVGAKANGAPHANGGVSRVVYPYRKWNGLAETLPLYLL